MSPSSEAGTGEVVEQTGVGSYFVANYPPFSAWNHAAVASDALPALQRRPVPGVPLGLYLHVPFCRKRCHFCYFRVYTDKNADEVGAYLDTLVREMEMYARMEAIGGRELDFVYFGGGTPSFLSTRQLDGLVTRLRAIMPWDAAREVTFECEPGTLTSSKLTAIRDLGVTRLSLGIEHFDDRILELNGRAHRSAEIHTAYDHARSLGFPLLNVDLIAGMLGDTDLQWQRAVDAVLDLGPDSVTIYQMELPFNTTISSDILKGEGRFQEPVADWPTKRRWVGEAFERLEGAGYTVRTAYSAVRDTGTRFVYTDRLWEGADMAALGVASFGHIDGVHMQNLDRWDAYAAAVESGRLPLARAHAQTDEERMIREFILQLKRGAVSSDYFRQKFGVDPRTRFAEHLAALRSAGYVSASGDGDVRLSRDGLLRIDSLLPGFFLPEHRDIRYT